VGAHESIQGQSAATWPWPTHPGWSASGRRDDPFGRVFMRNCGPGAGTIPEVGPPGAEVGGADTGDADRWGFCRGRCAQESS
jgi:hypothetical protein